MEKSIARTGTLPAGIVLLATNRCRQAFASLACMAMRNYRIGGELIFKVLREAETRPVNKKFGTCELTEVIRLRQLDLKGGRR